MKRDPMRLVELCRGKIVYIQTHNFPDPDAIGSAFGLQKLLNAFGIDAELCYEGLIDKLSASKMLSLCGIRLRPYAEFREQMQPEDMIILVDCQKNNGNTTDLPGDELAVIDHHPVFVKTEYRYHDLRITGACCSMIAEYYRLLKVIPSMEAATAMLYGLRMDTLSLSRGVTAFDIRQYEYLFRYADPDLLSDLEQNNMVFSDLQAYGTAISHVQTYGKIGFSYIGYSCPDGMLATLADFLLSLREVEVVILYSCRPTGYKFSVRSENALVHAGNLINRVLKDLGNGGGHAEMAGGFVEKEVLDALGAETYLTVQELFLSGLRKEVPELME